MTMPRLSTTIPDRPSWIFMEIRSTEALERPLVAFSMRVSPSFSSR